MEGMERGWADNGMEGWLAEHHFPSIICAKGDRIDTRLKQEEIDFFWLCQIGSISLSLPLATFISFTATAEEEVLLEEEAEPTEPE
jgi:hypothetical protein